MALSIKRNGKKEEIVSKVVLRKSYLSKAFGLMFRFSLKDEAHIFFFEKEKIIPLHMLFVFTPIDVVFLNKNKRVVEAKKLLSPFSFFRPSAKAMYVVELPPKTIKEKNIVIRDHLEF